jgi:hypothetical protein
MWWHSPNGRRVSKRPCPTTSLDAALTLVPEEWRREILDWPDAPAEPRGAARLEWLDPEGFRKPRKIPSDGWIWATTPALALCIAALKAKDAGE